MKFFIYLIVLTSLVIEGQGQRVCGTSVQTNTIHSTYSRGNGATSLRDTVPNEIINIPVVIHVIFNTAAQNISDQQILSQLAVLNNDYRRLNSDATNTPEAFQSYAADTRIMFCLAQIDPTGRPTKGIIRKHANNEFFQGDDAVKFSAAGGDDAWDSNKYLNIWVCSLFGRSLGYATPPGGPADKDGVVINFDVFGTTGSLRSNFDKGRTATHEVGHWMGLKHIWGDESCGSDDVDDTPRQLSYNFNCPSFPHVTNCSVNGYGDMFMNYMDLTNDACMNMFTTGQKIKMRSVFSSNGLRNSFLNSFACDSSLASGAPVAVDDTLPITKPRADVRVYPNPVSNFVNLQPINEYSLKDKSCTVYSFAGVRLFHQSLSTERPVINISSLPAGVYILQIGEGSDKRMVKIIKI